MGICAGKVEGEGESKKNHMLEEQCFRDAEAEMKIIKLLLLGPGDSGKSTLLKQLVQLHGEGIGDEELMVYVETIQNNLIHSLKTLCEESAYYGGINPQLKKSKDYIVDVLFVTDKLSPEIGKHFVALWSDPGIQRTYRNRSKFQLLDNAAYFLDSARRICADDYKPTYDDVIRCRTRTTGIVEKDFRISETIFRVVDVGGQRNERRKWIHCFENVTAVLFLAALSEYDQLLYEDRTTNRITEAIALFESICNSPYFRQVCIILMLNKNDLFVEKIKLVPLSVCFPHYSPTGKLPPEDEAYNFIKSKFEETNANSAKHLYCHRTCATDKENIQLVFNAVRDSVLRKSLTNAGLLM